MGVFSWDLWGGGAQLKLLILQRFLHVLYIHASYSRYLAGLFDYKNLCKIKMSKMCGGVRGSSTDQKMLRAGAGMYKPDKGAKSETKLSRTNWSVQVGLAEVSGC
jgi:hypothetical protein